MNLGEFTVAALLKKRMLTSPAKRFAPSKDMGRRLVILVGLHAVTTDGRRART
jgi:hypothetical protein